jgi:hypothetical protein
MNFEEKKAFAVEFTKATLDDHKIPFLRVEVVGSAYIHEKETSDIDVLAHIDLECTEKDIYNLVFNGWEYGGSAGEGDDSIWGSWKKTIMNVEVNMLLTTDKEFFNNWLTSAEVCKYLHRRGILKDDRSDRIAIHQIIMEDQTTDILFPIKQALPEIVSFY